MNNKIKMLISGMVAVLLFFLMAGCIADTFSKKPENEKSQAQKKSRKTTAVYYDFEDVLIPLELKIVDNKTVVVSSPGFTSGIIALRGRVERRSLFNFFNNNMQKDNWNIMSQIKSPGTTIMVFHKAGKTAVITIRDEQFNTYVEVGVAPTVQESRIERSGFSDSVILE